MLLKSFGCSFIFGSELADDGWGTRQATPSQLTWPALLAKHLNYDYQCYARPGSGNLQILERILIQAASQEPSLFVVGWTWIDRYDYIDPVNDLWKTITPTDQDGTARLYYRDLHSQYRDKLTCLGYMNLAIEVLKQHGHKYIMTCMDDLVFETQWHCTPAIELMQSTVLPSLSTFEGQNFLDWSKANGFPIGQRGQHPLEPAHQAAFELIKNYRLTDTV